MSNNEYYSNYKEFISKINEKEKIIRQELTEYKKLSSGQELTIDIENKIKGHLKEYKDSMTDLENAYHPKAVPGFVPINTIDQRQKEIQGFGIKYNEMQKLYNDIENKKYSFKNLINEDYSQKEEYKNMSNEQLLVTQNKKLSEQDDKLDYITMDVKKGTVLARNAKNVIKEQNKQLDQIDEDIDRTREKMNTLTGRFNNYVAHTSTCKMILILIAELVAAFLIFFFLILD